MARLLNLLLIALFIITFTKGGAMAENAGYRYNAIISTNGIVWSFRVNDIFRKEVTSIAPSDSSPNISTELQTGKNTLSLLFAPLTGQDPTTGEYIAELRDGLEIDISVRRNGWAEGTTEEINLVRIRYDAKAGQWIKQDKTYDGRDRVYNTAHLRADGPPHITNQMDHEIVFSSVLKIDGYRLDVNFDTSDYFPPFPWVNDSVVLKDTPQMRRELRDAYQKLYRSIENDDGEAVLAEVGPVWERTAYMLTDYGSAREYIESPSHGGLDRFKRVLPDGAVLRGFDFDKDPQGDQLQFMAENHLVRIRPEPIVWEGDPSKGPDFTKFPVVFYKTRSGQWHVGAVATRF